MELEALWGQLYPANNDLPNQALEQTHCVSSKLRALRNVHKTTDTQPQTAQKV